MSAMIQYVLYLAILVVLAIPLGAYIKNVMSGEKTFLSKVLTPCENLIYKVTRVDREEQMTWKKYAVSVMIFSGIGLVFLFLLQLLQGVLPGNPQNLSGVKWDLAFNTSASFIMTKPLKAELLAWLEKLKQNEQNAPEKYSNCGQLFRLPDGLPIAPELLTKWYRLWRAEHPEFEQIVFHGLRHSSATYQLLQSDGDFKSVQGNTGHATASVLMDTYAHTQDKPRLELTEKIEANFYSQDLTSAASQPRQNEKPAATKISGREILEAIRLMDADERRELTRALFA